MRAVAPKDPYSLLTSREKEVLQLVAERNSNAQIAKKLFISRRTVEIHRSHIMKKLGLHRPHVDLIRYAAERGLIKPIYQVADE
jgi:two-component system response regulator NreC